MWLPVKQTTIKQTTEEELIQDQLELIKKKDVSHWYSIRWILQYRQSAWTSSTVTDEEIISSINVEIFWSKSKNYTINNSKRKKNQLQWKKPKRQLVSAEISWIK